MGCSGSTDWARCWTSQAIPTSTVDTAVCAIRDVIVVTGMIVCAFCVTVAVVVAAMGVVRRKAERVRDHSVEAGTVGRVRVSWAAVRDHNVEEAKLVLGMGVGMPADTGRNRVDSFVVTVVGILGIIPEECNNTPADALNNSVYSNLHAILYETKVKTLYSY